MAVAICRHAGARNIVISDVNSYRLELAREMGASVAINVAETSIKGFQRELHMNEGFDVRLEMSAHPDAFRAMIRNMCHGGRGYT